MTELAAQDCLADLVKYLPPISLVDPLCSVITETQDDELKMVAYNTILQLPLLLKASIQVRKGLSLRRGLPPNFLGILKKIANLS